MIGAVNKADTKGATTPMFKKAIILLAASSLVLASFSSAAEARPRHRSSMDRAIAQCVGAIGIGAILGAVIGNNTGSGNGGRGAVAGAVVGAGACAIILAMRNRRDRDEMARLETEAADADGPQYSEYRGDDGRRRQIKVDIQPAAAPRDDHARISDNSGPPRECRMRQTTLTVDGQQTQLEPETICRDPVTHSWSVVDS